MRRILSFIFMTLACLAVHAQFSSVNSFMRREIVSYTKNDKGFYVKNGNKMTDAVTGVVENYAYDKKRRTFMFLQKIVMS